MSDRDVTTRVLVSCAQIQAVLSSIDSAEIRCHPESSKEFFGKIAGKDVGVYLSKIEHQP